MILTLLGKMWKTNRKKIKLYGLLLYLLCIGVPLYAQQEAIQTKDSLVNQIPINEAPVPLRAFDDIPRKYNSSDFDYTDTSKKGEAFLEGLWKIFIRAVEKIIKFLYGKNRGDVGMLTLVRILGVLLLTVALFFIIRWVLRAKGRWFLARSAEKFDDIPLSEIEKHIHEVDFAELIQKAEKQNDTRQSIRLYYLWLLRVLSDRKRIEWNIRKTNSDYEREIQDPTEKANFMYLSKVYNYIWYGEFSINDTQYQQAKSDYQGYINAQKSK